MSFEQSVIHFTQLDIRFFLDVTQRSQWNYAIEVQI